MTDQPGNTLPPPDPDVEADLALHGVSTDAAPVAQVIAETMGVPVEQIVEDLGDAFAIIAALQRGDL